MDSHIKFTKMHGLGNDYIYIDCISQPEPTDTPELSRTMSPRHTAVGADGIILILPSDIADFRMRIFNADGSEALMCGNGSRCVGKYVYDHALTQKKNITLETASGVKYLLLSINGKSGKVDEVTVDMGVPSLNCKDVGMNYPFQSHIEQPLISLDGEHDFKLTAVSIGNPHGVIFIDSPLNALDIESVGPAYENHRIWSNRANIEFINIIDDHHISMRVWERGSGETMACGTGACAAAFAAIVTNRCQSPVEVTLPGGNLTISLDSRGHLMMTGPAEEVYSGIWDPC